MRKLANLNRPLREPPSLIEARAELTDLRDVARRRAKRLASLDEAIARLNERRPTGFWAWLTGRTQAYHAGVALKSAEQAQQARASKLASIAYRAAEARVNERDAGWQRKLRAIEKNRSTKRTSVRAEINWLRDACTCVDRWPQLADCPQELLHSAIIWLRAKKEQSITSFETVPFYHP